MISAVKDMLKQEKKKQVAERTSGARRGSADRAHKLSHSSHSSGSLSDALTHKNSKTMDSRKQPSSSSALLSASSGSRDRDVEKVSEFQMQFEVADTSSNYRQLQREMAERRAKADKQNGVSLVQLPRLSRANSRSSLLSLISLADGFQPSTAAPWAVMPDGPRQQSPVTGAPDAIHFDTEADMDPLISELTQAASAMKAAGDRRAASPNQQVRLDSPPRLTPPLSMRDKAHRSKISAPLNRKVEGVPLLVIERATSLPDLRVLLARAIKQRKREQRAARKAARRAAKAARNRASDVSSAPSAVTDAGDKGLGSVFAMVARALVASADAAPRGAVRAWSAAPDSDEDASGTSDADGSDEYDESDAPFTLVELCEMRDSGAITEAEFQELKTDIIFGRNDTLLPPEDE